MKWHKIKGQSLFFSWLTQNSIGEGRERYRRGKEKEAAANNKSSNQNTTHATPCREDVMEL